MTAMTAAKQVDQSKQDAFLGKMIGDIGIMMSVCTGAFLVARAGLFDRLKATTHHDAYDRFEQMFPKVTLVRGPRYVENRNVSSSGGESSGYRSCFSGRRTLLRYRSREECRL